MSKGGGTTYVPTTSGQTTSGAQTATTTLPDWLNQGSAWAVQRARDLAAMQTPLYTWQMAAGLSPGQTAAGTLLPGMVGAGNPGYAQAASMFAGATGSADPITAQTFRSGLKGIGDYMNPYVNNVIKTLQPINQQNLDLSLTQTADKALGAGAFGGSRHGVQEGVATAQNNMLFSNLVADLKNQAYYKATDMLGQDIGNNLTAQRSNQSAQMQQYQNMIAAAQGMSQNTTAQQQMNSAAINNLMQYGNLQQATNQNQLSTAYQNWLWQQQYPYMQNQALTSALQTVPTNRTVASTSSGNQSNFGMTPQTQQSSSPLLGALGLGMSGLSWLSGMGGVSGISGLLGMGARPSPSTVYGAMGNYGVPTF